MKKSVYLSLFLLLCVPAIFGEELFTIHYFPGEKYKITEVSNFRKRVDGKYIGLVSRQVRGIMDVIPREGGGFGVHGNYYIFEQTKHEISIDDDVRDRETLEIYSYPNG